MKKTANPTRAFSLFHSNPFVLQNFESFFDFVRMTGLFENHDNVQRLIASGLPAVLTQVSLSPHVFLEKGPNFNGLLSMCF